MTRSALETAHSAFCLHILYTYVVSWAGDTLAVANLVWSVLLLNGFGRSFLTIPQELWRTCPISTRVVVLLDTKVVIQVTLCLQVRVLRQLVISIS